MLVIFGLILVALIAIVGGDRGVTVSYTHLRAHET